MLDVAGKVDFLLSFKDRIEAELADEGGAALGDDGIALAGFLAISRFDGHICYRMSFVVASVDGIVLGNGVSGDAVHPGKHGIDRCPRMTDAWVASWAWLQRGRRASEAEDGHDSLHFSKTRKNSCNRGHQLCF